MTPVADVNGVVLPGMFRNETGGIIVNNKQTYAKAIAERKQFDKMQDQIDTLNNTVKELSDLIRNMVK